jgi:hypothetical protein
MSGTGREDRDSAAQVHHSSDQDAQAFELFGRILQSEGERIYWKLEVLRASYYVFSRNHAELSKAIEHFQSAEHVPRYWGNPNREAMRAFQRENMRLLHNFLSGAFTLVDHTRILVRETYTDHPFGTEYQKRVEEEFTKSDIAGFVKGMRNWMVHRGIVPVRMQATLGAEQKLVASIVLDLEELRSWERWDPRALRYLSGVTVPLRLQDVVRSYYDRVERFYSWLGGRMGQIHSAAFEEWARMQEQHQAMLRASGR